MRGRFEALRARAVRQLQHPLHAAAAAAAAARAGGLAARAAARACRVGRVRLPWLAASHGPGEGGGVVGRRLGGGGTFAGEVRGAANPDGLS